MPHKRHEIGRQLHQTVTNQLLWYKCPDPICRDAGQTHTILAGPCDPGEEMEPSHKVAGLQLCFNADQRQHNSMPVACVACASPFVTGVHLRLHTTTLSQAREKWSEKPPRYQSTGNSSVPGVVTIDEVPRAAVQHVVVDKSKVCARGVSDAIGSSQRMGR